MKSKFKLITVFSLIIIIFGLLGCVPCAAGIYYLSKISASSNIINIINYSNINYNDNIGNKNIGANIVGSNNAQTKNFLETVNESINSLISLLDNSSYALKNASYTITDAQNALIDASKIMKSTSISLNEVSKTIEFEILGVKPLAGVSNYFKSISKDMAKFSENLEKMSTSIGLNVEDLKKLSEDIDKISLNITIANNSFNKSINLIPNFSFINILYIVLSYLFVLNIIFILIGISLIVLTKKTNPPY